MTTVSIIPAKLKDLNEIMSLELLGFPAGIAERIDVFNNRIKLFPEGFLLIREKESGKAIGYICSEIWIYKELVDAEMFTLNHSIETTHNLEGTEIYISSMTIHPEYRNRGLGRFLFSSCVNNLVKLNSKICSAILIVNETWNHAKQIYLKEGFVELFRIENFFTPDGMPPQAGIVMRCPLSNSEIKKT